MSESKSVQRRRQQLLKLGKEVQMSPKNGVFMTCAESCI